MALDGVRGGGGWMRQAVKGVSRWMRYEGLFVCLHVFTGFQLSQVWISPCHNDGWCRGVSLVFHEVSMLYYLFKRLKPFWGMETRYRAPAQSIHKECTAVLKRTAQAEGDRHSPLFLLIASLPDSYRNSTFPPPPGNRTLNSPNGLTLLSVPG